MPVIVLLHPLSRNVFSPAFPRDVSLSMNLLSQYFFYGEWGGGEEGMGGAPGEGVTRIDTWFPETFLEVCLGGITGEYG